MPKLTNSVPKYRKHASGNARVSINGRDYLLGPHGTKASKVEYDRIIAEYLASGRSRSFGMAGDDLTMAMVMADYLGYAKAYYGTGKSSEWHRIKLAIKPIKLKYAALNADEFGPTEFKAIQQAMIDSGLSRTGINAHMKRITRMMKWCAGEGKIPASVFETLRLIPGLKKGRTKARETGPVMPVSIGTVEATLKFLNSVVADMVRVQMLTGCRPGEVCSLAPAMIDRSSDVWVARLGEHKTAHHGHERFIYFGPKAQVILKPYLLRCDDDCLFRPCDADKKRREEQHARRVVSLSYGNRPGTNRKSKPKLKPGVQYDVGTYGKAIGRAAKKASVEHWSPNRLRHTRATEIRKEFGLEAAQVVLGHSAADVTQVYAERDAEKAVEVARKTG